MELNKEQKQKTWIKSIVIFILTPKYLKISALSIDVPTDSRILRLQKPHSVVYRQTLSHS